MAVDATEFLGRQSDTYVLPTLIPQVPGLDDDLQQILFGLMSQLLSRSASTLLKRRYYDAHSTLRDFGISIPPQMRNVDTVLGWPAKAVDQRAARIVLEGVSAGGGDTASLGLDEMWDRNRLDVELPQAFTSTLMDSCAFVCVTAGDAAAGEPPVLVSVRSATQATGLWDRRTRSLKAALSIIDSNPNTGQVREWALYIPNLVVMGRWDGSGWDLRQVQHELGVPVEPIVNRPALTRPFGKSVITRPVRSLTDQAVRALVRTETSAEFYNAPQRYVLGASEDSFMDASGNPIPGWTAILGRIMALTRDEDGNVPTVGQFPQQSMQPNIEHLREIASLFAAEVDLPVSSLGIVQDNPSSAEAIFAAKEDLVIDCGAFMRTNTPALNRVVRNIVRMLDRSIDQATLEKLHVRWGNPATPSVVSAADAIVKQVQALPLLADSPTIVLRAMGYSPDEIAQVLSDHERANATSAIDRVLAAPGGVNGGQAAGGASGNGAEQGGGAGAAGAAASVPTPGTAQA